METEISVNTYFIFLAIGHVLADFYFQTNKIAAEKAVSIKGVMKHAIEDAVCNLFFCIFFFSFKLLAITLLSAVVHFGVDTLKLRIGKAKKFKGKYIFLGDQAVHIITMLLIAMLMKEWNVSLEMIDPYHSFFKVLAVDVDALNHWALALFLIFRPCHFLVRAFMTMRDPIDEEDQAFQFKYCKKGRIVGYVERTAILILCHFNFYAIVGIVLLLKTILKMKLIDHDDVYGISYVQGTLISLVYALLVELIVL